VRNAERGDSGGGGTSPAAQAVPCRLQAPRTLNGRERHGRSRLAIAVKPAKALAVGHTRRPLPVRSGQPLGSLRLPASSLTWRRRPRRWVSEDEPSSWKRFRPCHRGWNERMTEDPEGARTPRGERPNPGRSLRRRRVLRGAGRRQRRHIRDVVGEASSETGAQTTEMRKTPKALASPPASQLR
jgi:hypothetical protein